MGFNSVFKGLKCVKEIGRLGRWILRLAPFKFRVVHTKGSENVVADALSRIFEGTTQKSPEMVCTAILESLPLVYSSLHEHQLNDEFCVNIRQKITSGLPGAENFKIRRDLVCCPKRYQE